MKGYPKFRVREAAIKKRTDVTPADKRAAVKQYGNVTYADEKNKKYPIDTDAHIRAAWNYINKANNAAKYTAEEVKAIKAKIVAAWKKVIDKAGPPSAVTESFQGEESLDEQIRKIESAFDAQFNPTGPNGEYMGHDRWVREVFSDKIAVRWGRDESFLIPYTVTGEAVTFGAPDTWQKIEQSWVPVAESVRIIAAKAGNDQQKGLIWEVTIIGPDTESDLVTEGTQSYIRSKNGRLYSCAALEAAVPLFANIKVYDNHLTDAQLAENQGMRSVVKEMVGVITDPTWNASRHAIEGTLKVVDENLRSKLVLADEGKVLDTFGLSIDAIAESADLSIGGKSTSVISSIAQALSVDVVADPAAGGRLSRMIAGMSPLQKYQVQEATDMTPEELQALVEAAIAKGLAPVQAELDKVKESLAGNSAEGDPKTDPAKTTPPPTPDPTVEATLKKVEEAAHRAEAALKAAEEREKIAECNATLSQKLTESGLPDTVKNLIAKQYRGRAFEAAALDASIKEHREALLPHLKEGTIIIPDGAGIAGDPLSTLDKYELGFLRLVAGSSQFGKIAVKESALYNQVPALKRFVEAGNPKIHIPVRLSEFYYDFTGGDYEGVGQFKRITEANLTSTSLASIVKNTVNILLAADYNARNQWWSPIVRQEDVDTLDQSTLVRVFGLANLASLSEGDPYNELNWDDEEETAVYQKRGNYIGVTLETFLQDKLNVLRTLPTKLSDSWYNTVSALVANVFLLNTAAGPVLSDTGALFNAVVTTTAGGHANLLTAALDFAGFGAARTAMMKQTVRPLGVGSRKMITPRYLLVPADLEHMGLRIRNSEYIPGSANNDINPYYQKIDVIPVPEFTDATDWALVADPAQFPAIWLIWLRGRRTPELFTADDEKSGAMFTNDELRFKVRQFGFKFSATYDCAPVADFRPLHKSNVAG